MSAAAARIIPPAHPAPKHRPHEHTQNNGDETRQHNGNGRNQHIAISDMRKLMSQNPFKFRTVKTFQKAGGYGHSRMLRISSGSKSIRSRVLNQIKFWHGKPRGYVPF